MKTLNPILLIAIALVLLNCTSVKQGIKPHKKYIVDHDYTPFTIFRDGDGVGTIITFKDGFESLIATKDRCLTKLEIDTLKVDLPDFSYTLESKNKQELSASKFINDKIELSEAFKSGAVKKVKVEFIDPFEIRLQRIDVDAQLQKMASSGNGSELACLDAIINKENLLIERTLGAKKVKYSFLNDQNQEIILDAKFMENINLTNDLQRKYSGSTSIDIDFPILIGYRAWNISSSPGLAIPVFNFIEVSISDMTKKKEGSKSK